MHFNKEPEILFGEGNYAINNVKEIDVTEAFLNLAEEVKNCQNVETFRDCETKEYIKLGLTECKCTPYALRNFSKNVIKTRINFNLIISNPHLLGSSVHSSWTRLLQIYK